jgi:UDP-glucose 4-epimerase
MEKSGCTAIIFSSSATVYGDAPIPYTEESEAGISTPLVRIRAAASGRTPVAFRTT